MELTVKINLDNDSFATDTKGKYNGEEISDILEGLIYYLKHASVSVADRCSLNDSNGNAVGHWKVD